VNAISASQELAITSTQHSAFTSIQLGALNYISPIVLDLKGSGIDTLSVDHGVQFDITGTGVSQKTGWVAEGEGLLVLDPNNAPLTSGTQLFGQGMTLENGQKAVNGYQALSALDTNGDGVINSSDAAFSELKVWVDTGNVNGTATGVLESLDQLGIAQLNLNAQSSTQMNNGNIVGLVSSYQTTSGATGTMADVWFATQVAGTTSSSSSVITNSGTALTASALSANVSTLAGAISSFSAISSGTSTASSLSSPSASTSTSSSLSSQVATASIALTQFTVTAASTSVNSAVSVNSLNSSSLSTNSTSQTPLVVPTTKK
jgi:hypothetical protein